jgi:hypothetical protein
MKLEMELFSTDTVKNVTRKIKMTHTKPEYQEVRHYLHNLNMEGLMQVAGQLIMYPDSREFILKAIAEWSEFYRFPLNGEKVE